MKEDAKTNEKTAEKLGQMVAMGDDAQAAAAAGCIYNQARASYLVDKKLGRTIDDAMPDKLAKASVILGNLERGSISPRDAYSKLTEIFDEQDLVPRKIESESEQPTSETAGNDDDSTQKNINDGMDALDHVLATHIDENKAMNRPEIGPIDFVWGKEGTAAKDYEDGYGIAKILKKHGKTAVDAIPEVIAKGTFSQRYKDRVYFEHNGYRAVVRLTWDGKAKTWLVTNFEQTKEANPGAEEDRRSASKHAGTSSSKGLASSTHIIPHEQKEGIKNLAYTDGRFSDNSKDDNAMRGTVKNGVMTIWRKRGKKKDESIITISVDEVNEALKKGSANYKITESYLLQYYLDNGMRDAYEETATDYFDGKTKPMDRYQYIITEGVKEQSIIGFRYALYVFVRGLYLFEMDQCNRAMKEKLLSIKKTAEKNKQNINIHPWEIIYKYLILIAVKLKDPTMEETFTRDYESLSLKEGATIEALMRFNRAEIAVAKGNIQERDKCLNDLKGFFLDKFDGYDEVQFSVSGDALFELFSKYFTYMYH